MCQCVDARVLQQLVAALVDFRCIGVLLEVASAGYLAWEVVAGVEELEEASDGIEILVNEVNSALLVTHISIGSRRWEESAHGDFVAELGASVCEPWALHQQSLVRSQQSLLVALANQEPDDWTLQVVNVCDSGWVVVHCFFLERHSVASLRSSFNLNWFVACHFNVCGDFFGHASLLEKLAVVSH